MGTLSSKLILLARPGMGFMQKIRVADDAIAGFTFANGWVSSPRAQAGPMPVSGRGKNREEALNVMIMEAVERNSSAFAGDENLRQGYAGELTAAQWRRLLPFSNHQIASRKPVPTADEDWVGASLSNKTRIHFAEGRSLHDSKRVAIPAALVYLQYFFAGEPRYAFADTNGCAAGQTLNDAEFRGLLELIERDAFGIWWFNRIERTKLLFDADDVLCEMAAALAAEERLLHLVELTTDLRTPVVAALISDFGGRRIYIGCASDISEVSAARKAASEALGFWFWGRLAVDPPSRRRWLNEATFQSEPWLKPKVQRPLDQRQAIQFGDTPALVTRLTAIESEPFSIDLTRKYFDIPVVRVMAPGLASQLPRFSPGRLYDLPVKMGWIQEPRREGDLLRYQSPL